MLKTHGFPVDFPLVISINGLLEHLQETIDFPINDWGFQAFL